MTLKNSYRNFKGMHITTDKQYTVIVKQQWFSKVKLVLTMGLVSKEIVIMRCRG